jgi:hypothetical protein
MYSHTRHILQITHSVTQKREGRIEREEFWQKKSEVLYNSLDKSQYLQIVVHVHKYDKFDVCTLSLIASWSPNQKKKSKS